MQKQKGERKATSGENGRAALGYSAATEIQDGGDTSPPPLQRRRTHNDASGRTLPTSAPQKHTAAPAERDQEHEHNQEQTAS